LLPGNRLMRCHEARSGLPDEQGLSVVTLLTEALKG
jgi:hypothetical protein